MFGDEPMNDDLFRRIQATCGGEGEAAVMQALLQSLLVVIGVSAPSLARAEALLDALPAELKPRLRAEWLNYREHRAKASVVQSESSH